MKIPLGKPKPTGLNHPDETELLYNEFIVYDTAQIRMRYLLQVVSFSFCACSFLTQAAIPLQRETRQEEIKTSKKKTAIAFCFCFKNLHANEHRERASVGRRRRSSRIKNRFKERLDLLPCIHQAWRVLIGRGDHVAAMTAVERDSLHLTLWLVDGERVPRIKQTIREDHIGGRLIPSAVLRIGPIDVRLHVGNIEHFTAKRNL